MSYSALSKGRITFEAANEAKARLRATSDWATLREADLIIEAVFESLTVKTALFRQLGQLCNAEAVLATNTSALDVDAIAAASGRMANVVGMHFFSPAHVMKLVEIVQGQESSSETLATAWTVSRRLKKIAVICANRFGFVGNRMLYAYGREKELLMLQGASPERIDHALENFGMAMGPNAVGDLTGLDIGANARRQWKDRPDDPRYFRVSDLLVERGGHGQKSGRGFYRYDDQNKRRQPDQEVNVLIEAEAERLGIPRREISDEEIVERCTVTLINEGARILEAGITRSAADIDVVWCNGYGFPRTRGGPMFYADTMGLAAILAIIEKYQTQEGDQYWTPAPLLVRFAKEGQKISEWRS